MYIITAFVLAFVLTTALFVKSNIIETYQKENSSIWYFTVVVFYSISFIVFFICFTFIGKNLGALLPHQITVERTWTEYITALKDDFRTSAQVKGSFLHISGITSNELVYVFFVDARDGSIQSRIISDRGLGKVRIFEHQEEITPWYDVYREIKVCTAPKWTYWISSCDGFPTSSDKPVRYDIHVPAGTIIQDITIDLE